VSALAREGKGSMAFSSIEPRLVSFSPRTLAPWAPGWGQCEVKGTVAAEIIGRDGQILNWILEPDKRKLSAWAAEDEATLRNLVERRARRTPRARYVQYDPERDQAETVDLRPVAVSHAD
jgi:hypothetical protein